MFSFILRKMLSNKWLIVSLLIGNLLLSAMVSSVPVYSDAIMKRMVGQTMQERQADKNVYPLAAEMKMNSLNAAKGKEIASLGNFTERAETFEQAMELPLKQDIAVYSTGEYEALGVEGRKSENTRMMRLQFITGAEEHIKLTGGRMYSREVGADGVIETIVNERTLVERDLILGEVLEMRQARFDDGRSVRFKVVGTYTNSEENDEFWYYSPQNFTDVCLMDESLFMSLFIDNHPANVNFTVTYYKLFDYTALDAAGVKTALEATDAAIENFERFGQSAFKASYRGTLEQFLVQSEKLTMTMWVLQAPMFVLFAFFIFMVSKQILEQEKNSIAVIKSRGASRGQVIRIFLGQSMIVAAISFLLGLPLGLLICRVLGASDGFLGLVSRAALEVRLVPEAFMYSGIAAVLSVLMMVVPAFKYSKITIVDHKRSTTGRKSRPIWQKFFLDIILLAESIYGLYSYNNQKDLLSAGGGGIDPLLFINSSLFVIGAGLLLVRIFPLLMKLIFRVGRRFWSPSLYASFLRITRSVGEEQFIMIFLVLTIATGIFSASAARTINLNMEQNIRYEYGADVVLAEKWDSNKNLVSSSDAIVYYEPDYERYAPLGQSGALYTKVQRTEEVSTVSPKVSNITLLGIDTKQFGEIAWFRDGLLPAHQNEYLNAMASDARAVLLSTNFHTKQNVQLGDTINLKSPDGAGFSGVVCGFVDYWPSLVMTETVADGEGGVTYKDYYFAVANIAQVQSQWGVTPYEVWIKCDSASPVYELAEAQGMRFETFLDADAAIVGEKNSPVLQGTNGVLTVSFIIVLVVCMTGFLIYWILSIRSRVLQFGIFRAMGMSMRSIFMLLVSEQLFISGTSIAFGTLVGVLASKFFVPLIQLGYSAGENALPLQVAAEGGDFARLFIVIGAMLAVCIAILCALISKIRIAQALKLGED